MKRTSSSSSANGNGYKKGRGGDDDEMGGGASFEEELMMMDEMIYESIDPDVEMSVEQQEQRWARTHHPLDPATEALGCIFSYDKNY